MGPEKALQKASSAISEARRTATESVAEATIRANAWEEARKKQLQSSCQEERGNRETN